jgi:hypothetical protein
MDMDWDNCTKAAITKQFFPNVRRQLENDYKFKPELTAMVTGHGTTGA